MSLSILTEGDPERKAHKVQLFRQSVPGRVNVDWASPPDYPSRPEHPELVPAKQLARRRLGSPKGRAALLHAIADIDLAADMIA